MDYPELRLRLAHLGSVRSLLAAPESRSAASTREPVHNGRLRRRVAILLALLALAGPPMVHWLGLGHGEVGWLLPFLALQVILVSWLRKPLWLSAWPVATAIAALSAMWLGLDGRVAVLATAGVSHAVFFAMLGIGLAVSLRPGRADPITSLARRLDPHWRPEMESYTRAVALGWTFFFLAQCAISGILLLTAPREVWSLFVLVLDLPLVALMFVAEYVARRLRFPDHPHVGPFSVVHALREGWMR